MWEVVKNQAVDVMMDRALDILPGNVNRKQRGNVRQQMTAVIFITVSSCERSLKTSSMSNLIRLHPAQSWVYCADVRYAQ